ncbi:hypothetical protein M5K25_008006 [Dendrobium thyrsiflorum]|uniref:Reverse transcriptase zinc-binding domain-containing protein n=1 Tax=Dendrobium thyrsiflorum TaxID=117978 RepID=A0ABD0VEU1_DENTH
MDALSELIDNGMYKGIEIHGFNISHLLYADDLLVFGKATVPNCNILTQLLATFAKASGLVVNYDKSSLLMHPRAHNPSAICSALLISEPRCSIPYLGLPISYKNLKVANFMPLLGLLTRKLSGWKAHLLSFAGRLQFLKFTILNSIAYWIRGSILPKTIIKAINKLSSKFLFFGNTDITHKLHMIAWAKVCRPMSLGGLGLHSPAALQFGFNCTLISRFYNSSSPLTRWLVMRYTSPWRTPQASASKFWNAVCETANATKHDFKFRISPNAPIAFFWDHWSSVENLSDYITASITATVGDFIVGNQWMLPSNTDSHIGSIIRTIPICDDVGKCLVWNNKDIGYFGAYILAFYKDLPTCSWAKHLWFKGNALRYSVFAWLCIAGGLKTAAALSLRNVYISPLCPLCHLDIESVNHLFFECNFSYAVLTKLIPKASVLLLRPTATQLFDWTEELNLPERGHCLLKLCICCVIYHVWKERNSRRFGGQSICPVTLYHCIQRSVRAKVLKWKNGDKLLNLI